MVWTRPLGLGDGDHTLDREAGPRRDLRWHTYLVRPLAQRGVELGQRVSIFMYLQIAIRLIGMKRLSRRALRAQDANAL
jgi:hypothetical protein